MVFKRIAGAIFLAAMALPVAGQQFPTASELLQATPSKSANAPRYALAFGKVMARIDKSGTTKFNYQKGRLVSEVLPNSVIGTYQYDRAGKFQGIAYNDGKTISVAYNADGSIAGLTSNTKARISFKGKPAPDRLALRAFLAIQRGVSTIQNNYCMGTDDDPTCTIIVLDSLPDTDNWGGGGGGGGWGPIEPQAGEGGIYPSTGTAYGNPGECKQYVCETGRQGFDQICAAVARPGADRAECYSRSTEYHSKCLRSCDTADWVWLNDFSFIWG